MTAVSSATGQEMIAFLDIFNSKVNSIGGDILTVITPSGRKYEACFVLETSPNSNQWVVTADRVRGLYNCSKCPNKIPGGTWFQVILKNGASPEPVVRLPELFLHKLNQHREDLHQLSQNEKCIQVFGK